MTSNKEPVKKQTLIKRSKNLDRALYRAIRLRADKPKVVTWVGRGSALGEHGAIWIALGLVGGLVDRERSDQWRRSTIAVAGAYFTSTTIKLLVRRSRPTELPALTKTPTGLSFPSSHAASSFAAARAFSDLLPAGPLYALAASLAYSRLFLGVHYPSDVVAGAALGSAIGSIARCDGRSS